MRILSMAPFLVACAAPPATTSQGSHHDGTYDPPAIELTKVATDGPDLFAMALDDQFLYWIDCGQVSTPALKRMPRDGGTIGTMTTFDGTVYGFAVDDDAIYVAVRTGEIERIDKTDGGATVLATAFNPTRVALDGDWVYYNVASNSGSVWRVAKSGGTPELVADGIDNPYDLAADSGEVFVSAMNEGKILGVVPGSAATVLASGWTATLSIRVVDDDLFFGAGGATDGELYRMPRDGGTPEQLTAPSSAVEADAQIVDVGGSELLWSGNAIPLGGDATTNLLDSNTGPLAIGAAADENGAFMGDFYTGDIYRLW